MKLLVASRHKSVLSSCLLKQYLVEETCLQDGSEIVLRDQQVVQGAP